jgi:hypothetical protein
MEKPEQCMDNIEPVTLQRLMGYKGKNVGGEQKRRSDWAVKNHPPLTNTVPKAETTTLRDTNKPTVPL